MGWSLKASWLVGLGFCTFAVAGSGDLVSEFGPSVTFEKGRELTMANLQEKVVFILFFQSWCPICNGWSGELFRQVTEKHGDNPKLVLVALKTDGASLQEARKYLEERKVDVTKWFIGFDRGEGFY